MTVVKESPRITPYRAEEQLIYKRPAQRIR
jgi:hypothetical protein